MKANQSKTILFVTGAFVSHLGWRPWQSYFESKGYTTYAPSWPNKQGTPEELRNKRPNDTALAKTTITDVVNSYADFIKTLPEKPIIIGHSFGGLITQILLDRGLAAAAVAVHSVPPFGVIPFEFSFLRSAWRSLGLFTSLDKTYMMSFETWQYAFTNGMSLADQQKAYEENTIPESKRVARGGLTLAAKVSFKKEHAPLLFIAGGKDHIIPASLNKRNFNSYKNKNSVVDFKQFDDNNHFVVSLPNWQTTAEYIYNWIMQH